VTLRAVRCGTRGHDPREEGGRKRPSVHYRNGCCGRSGQGEPSPPSPHERVGRVQAPTATSSKRQAPRPCSCRQWMPPSPEERQEETRRPTASASDGPRRAGSRPCLGKQERRRSEPGGCCPWAAPDPHWARWWRAPASTGIVGGGCHAYRNVRHPRHSAIFAFTGGAQHKDSKVPRVANGHWPSKVSA